MPLKANVFDLLEDAVTGRSLFFHPCRNHNTSPQGPVVFQPQGPVFLQPQRPCPRGIYQSSGAVGSSSIDGSTTLADEVSNDLGCPAWVRTSPSWPRACAKPRPLGKVRGHGHCIYKLRLCAEKAEKAATARPWTRPANGACGWPGRTTGLANAPIRLRNKRRPAKESLAKLRWPDGGKGR